MIRRSFWGASGPPRGTVVVPWYPECNENVFFPPPTASRHLRCLAQDFGEDAYPASRGDVQGRVSDSRYKTMPAFSRGTATPQPAH